MIRKGKIKVKKEPNNNIKNDKKSNKNSIKQTEKKQKKIKINKWKIFRAILLVILLVILVFAGIFIYKNRQREGNGLFSTYCVQTPHFK